MSATSGLVTELLRQIGSWEEHWRCWRKKYPVSRRMITTRKVEIENKIPCVTGLVTTAAPNTKPKEMEIKIPDIINPATKDALNTKETEIQK